MDDTNFSSRCTLVPKPNFLRSCTKVHWTKGKCIGVRQRKIFAAISSPVGSEVALGVQSISARCFQAARHELPRDDWLDKSPVLRY